MYLRLGRVFYKVIFPRRDRSKHIERENDQNIPNLIADFGLMLS